MRKMLASLLAPAGIFCLLVGSGPRLARATAADGARTGKKCDTCHISMTSKHLNIVGFYYRRKHTLAGAPVDQLQRQSKSSRGRSDTYKPRYVPGRGR
jgi:hypothetical protein